MSWIPMNQIQQIQMTGSITGELLTSKNQYKKKRER